MTNLEKAEQFTIEYPTHDNYSIEAFARLLDSQQKGIKCEKSYPHYCNELGKYIGQQKDKKECCQLCDGMCFKNSDGTRICNCHKEDKKCKRYIIGTLGRCINCGRK